MTLELELFAWTAPQVDAVTSKPARLSIADRAASFHIANPHVFTEMLRLARARIDRGDTYVSVKALWEELRVSLSTSGDEYRLNNSWTASYARMCIADEPRLAGVIELRTRKAK